jgi:hypothetical protein
MVQWVKVNTYERHIPGIASQGSQAPMNSERTADAPDGEKFPPQPIANLAAECVEEAQHHNRDLPPGLFGAKDRCGAILRAAAMVFGEEPWRKPIGTYTSTQKLYSGGSKPIYTGVFQYRQC